MTYGLSALGTEPFAGSSPASWTFTTPTAYEQSDDFFFGRYKVKVGVTLIKRDGHYEEIQYPWLGELASLTNGEDYFLGGHIYEISEALAEDLAADGYAPEGF